MTLDELLLSYRDYYGAYHHHKEQMAYVATVLYLSLASTLIVTGPQLFGDSGPSILEVKFLLITVAVAYLFVGWQLRNRETAADIVMACTTLAARRVAGLLSEPRLAPETWRGLQLPTSLVEELRGIGRMRGLLGAPRVSEALTYVAMAAWTIAAGARLAA